MQLFISHSRVNSSYALRLADELRQRQVEAWLDIRDLAPGAEWEKSVTAAIRDASGFVFLIGPSGPQDRWQTFEWQQIVSRDFDIDFKKPLIPVLIQNPDWPGFLKTRRAFVLGETPESMTEAADYIAAKINDPLSLIDEQKLELGRKTRARDLEIFRKYSQTLAKKAAKSADLQVSK